MPIRHAQHETVRAQLREQCAGRDRTGRLDRDAGGGQHGRGPHVAGPAQVEALARGIEAARTVQPGPERQRPAGGVELVAVAHRGEQRGETRRGEAQLDDAGGREVMLWRLVEGGEVQHTRRWP